MSKVVLHIGTHKTATTTIQDTFWANSALLEEHGIVYPRLSYLLRRNPITGHHGLVLEWGAMPKAYHLRSGTIGTLEKLAKKYAGSDKTLLLSSEEFSRAPSLAAMGRIRDALSAFDEVEVVCVLRTQWQFLQSIYLQVSRRRSAPPPPKLVQPVIKSGKHENLWVDYNGLLDQLEEVFAPGEISFLDFNDSVAQQGGILGTMLRHLGCDLDAGALAPVKGGASNVSPMSLAQWSATALAAPKTAPDWLVAKTTELLKAEFGENVKPCLFSRHEFKLLKDHFDARNAELATRRAAVQPGFAISPADDSGLNLFRDDIDAKFWLKMARLLVAAQL